MKNNILYFDCSYGVSGDMLVASLIDLGANKEYILNALQSLGLGDFKIIISKACKGKDQGIDFDVQLTQENNDHNLKYLFKNNKIDENYEKITKKVIFSKKFPEITQNRKRNLSQIEKLLSSSNIISKKSKELILKVFKCIAKAEAKAHKIDEQEVIFHEVGAMDSIVDIVSAICGIESLNAEKIYFSSLYEGKGKIMCRRGEIPVPTPAVVNIANEYSLTINEINFDKELITPTGIGILVSVGVCKDLDIAQETIIKSGIGFGKRAYNTPCNLKAYILKNNKK